MPDVPRLNEGRIPRYGIVIPACNEEACLPVVLRELRQVVDGGQFDIVVGVNGSSDRSAQVARELGVLVAETNRRGYGHGCQSAIELLSRTRPRVDAYIFLAGDGANDPRDIAALVAEHERGTALVIGTRTLRRDNWPVMGLRHVLANRALGFWCGCLTGQFFSDLGPLRLIERNLFEAMQLREWTYGWTIEPQVRAVLMGATIREVPVRERKRVAGVQKVSRVSWRHTLEIGLRIFAAGLRTRSLQNAPDFAPARSCAPALGEFRS